MKKTKELKEKLIKDCFGNERGNTVLIVALVMVVLLSVTALVVDLGFVYLERARLVTGAEASALAGAASFPYREEGDYQKEHYEDAIREAEKVAEKNGLKDFEIKLLPVDEDRKEEIEVVAKKEVGYTFARIMGYYEQEVRGMAAAEAVPISGFFGVVPFGIPEEDFEGDGTYDLKVPAGEGEEGNYQPLALGGTGTNNYRDNLEDGYDDILRTGDFVDTEPGNMGNPTSQGLKDRYYEDRREITIPIVSYMGEGRGEVEILGFGAFHLEDYDNSAPGHTVFQGTFHEKVADGELAREGKDYGLRGTRLVR